MVGLHAFVVHYAVAKGTWAAFRLEGCGASLLTPAICAEENQSSLMNRVRALCQLGGKASPLFTEGHKIC